MAAQRVVMDRVPAMVAGGLESISLIQPTMNTEHYTEPGLMETKPELWMPMIETADNVGHRYDVSREAQDEYALQSQQRTAAAQQAGRFDDEIVPLSSIMLVKDRETGAVSEKEVRLERDEGNRPGTSMEGLTGLEPVRGAGNFITAGNASQLSDGASACVIMDRSLAEKT